MFRKRFFIMYYTPIFPISYNLYYNSPFHVSLIDGFDGITIAINGHLISPGEINIRIA